MTHYTMVHMERSKYNHEFNESKATPVGVITNNRRLGAAEPLGQIMRDEFAQTDEVVDVRALRRRRHVFEAQIDGLDQAETAVDDAHGGDAVETVAYDASARRRRLRRGPEGTDAEFGGVGGPEVDAVAVDAEVVVLGANADERPEDVDDDDVMVVFAGVAHRHLEVRHAHARVDLVVAGIKLSASTASVITMVIVIGQSSVAVETYVQ